MAFDDNSLEYLGIDRNHGVLSMKKHDTLYGYRLADGELRYEIVGLAENVLKGSSYWNYAERWPSCLREDRY